MIRYVARVASGVRPSSGSHRATSVSGPVDIAGGLNGATKRAFDLLVAMVLIVLTAPLMIAIGLMIRQQDGGPALFRQTRIGRGGRRFTCYKFRSMRVDAAERLRELLTNDPEALREWSQNHKLKNDPRITKLGHFLRRSSLDELPQLFNILKGDMSLVGPRPIVFSEIQRYGYSFVYYAAGRPGVTGLWQVSGRSDIDYAERVQLDVKYAKSSSLMTDMGIMFMTLPAVLFSRGAY